MADEAEDKAKGIDKVDADIAKARDSWQRMRDAVAGEATIHGAGAKYLPKLKEESTPDYKARVGRTPWYNATARTLSALQGMLFRKDPQITTPTGIEALLKDVTLTGVPFVNFAKEVGEEVMTVGVAGVLIDHPAAPDTQGTPLTVAVAERLGLRPTMALYKCETFIGRKFRRIRNAWTLSQVRLMECAKVPDGEFGEKDVDQIRVLDLDPAAGDTYRVRLYRKNERGKWVQFGGDIVPLMNNAPIEYVPFIWVTPAGIVADVEKPPANDLADMNYKHYQVSADYEHACHFTALPTPYIAGLQPKVDPETGREVPQKFYIGSTVAWVFSDATTKVGFLEFQGSGIDSIKENLEGKEAKMAAIGARMLAPEKSGVEAADTMAMRHSGEQSVLASIATALDLAMTKALEWFALWAGQAGECAVKINRDFMPVVMDSGTLSAIVSAWQSGAISEEEMFDQLQRGDVIRSDKTYEDHKTEVENNPPLGMQGAQAAIDAIDNPPADDKNKDPKAA